MSHRITLFLLIILGVALISTGCAKRMTVCAPYTPGVDKMTIDFVCPYIGASYQTEVYKCPGDNHFRLDISCQLCGHRHRYAINHWPHNYWDSSYYFYEGWFFARSYWDRYWPRGYSRPYMRRPHSMSPPPRNFGGPRDVQPPRPMPRGQGRINPAPPPSYRAQPTPPPRQGGQGGGRRR